MDAVAFVTIEDELGIRSPAVRVDQVPFHNNGYNCTVEQLFTIITYIFPPCFRTSKTGGFLATPLPCLPRIFRAPKYNSSISDSLCSCASWCNTLMEQRVRPVHGVAADS